MNISWDPHPCANIGSYILQYTRTNRTSTSEAKNMIITNTAMQGVDCHQEPGGPYRCLISTASIINLYEQYTYQVAAVNSYGAGPYSELIYAKGIDFVGNGKL